MDRICLVEFKKNLRYLPFKFTNCLILSFLLISSVLEYNIHLQDAVNHSSRVNIWQMLHSLLFVTWGILADSERRLINRSFMLFCCYPCFQWLELFCFPEAGQEELIFQKCYYLKLLPFYFWSPKYAFENHAWSSDFNVFSCYLDWVFVAEMCVISTSLPLPLESTLLKHWYFILPRW